MSFALKQDSETKDFLIFVIRVYLKPMALKWGGGDRFTPQDNPWLKTDIETNGTE